MRFVLSCYLTADLKHWGIVTTVLTFWSYFLGQDTDKN